ncbi:MAG: CAP domain-containing protein [Chloroflexota bacterium]
MKRTHLLFLLSTWIILSSSTFLFSSNIHGQTSDDEYIVNLPLIIRGAELGSEGITPSEFEQMAIALTNQYRQANGCLSTLTMVPELVAAARGHSADMAENNYFSHNSQNGDLPWDRMKKAGYTDFQSAGENIAAGYITPEEVIEAWINSPGHRENMLNCTYNEIGIGYVYDEDSTFRHYWTQDFGQR